MKALAAGKHVLVEKPAANTAEETRAMFELAERKGLVLMEAMHTRCLSLVSTCRIRTQPDYAIRFHPAIQKVKAILDSGELGAIKSVTANVVFPKAGSETDVQFDYEMGGGALMGLGCE
jgi:predicted dehydrogenase